MGARSEPRTSWIEAATRAHMILSQALPDALLDELVAPGARPKATPVFAPGRAA
jgi:hypothetical protein